VTVPVSALVLAGGCSRRLGQDKRTLRLDGRHSLLERTVERVASLSDDVLVVGSGLPSEIDVGTARVVPDDVVGHGPLAGLVAGLTAARHARALVVGCDLPFLNCDVLGAMLDLTIDCELLVPRRADGTLEMLHAVYGIGCVSTARALLVAGRLRLAGLADELSARGAAVHYLAESFIRQFDPVLLTFFNVNTPADLAEARSRYGSC
jgi:molybdopterin-guanine dinucleotide biosynthesis protein A